MGSISALLCNRMPQEMDIDQDGGPFAPRYPACRQAGRQGGRGGGREREGEREEWKLSDLGGRLFVTCSIQTHQPVTVS